MELQVRHKIVEIKVFSSVGLVSDMTQSAGHLSQLHRKKTFNA